MNNLFLSLQKERRSIYALGDNLSIPDDELINTIKDSVKMSPSAFNSQSSRILILLRAQHQRFWSLVHHKLESIVPKDKFGATAAKIAMFSSAAGSVLFFEDQNVIASLQDNYPSYADNFPIWSEHSTGIAQYAVWLALAEKGIGANLQHYNPLIDDDVQKEWKIPASWKLRAHMNFGSAEQEPDNKTYINDEERFLIAK